LEYKIDPYQNVSPLVPLEIERLDLENESERYVSTECEGT